MDLLASAQDAIGIVFNNRPLLAEALTHSSCANESTSQVTNERLEFLGDAVLGMVIAARLFAIYPDEQEGRLSEFRVRLIRGDTLARAAAKINLGNYLRLGKGEEKTGGRTKPPNLAGALEAVIGAIYLDQGQDVATDFILRILGDELDAVADSGPSNYKSALRGLLQSRQQPAPSYHVVKTSGPVHKPLFTVEVRQGNTVLARMTGSSKKDAEQGAAETVFKSLSND